MRETEFIAPEKNKDIVFGRKLKSIAEMYTVIMWLKVNSHRYTRNQKGREGFQQIRVEGYRFDLRDCFLRLGIKETSKAVKLFFRKARIYNTEIQLAANFKDKQKYSIF